MGLSGAAAYPDMIACPGKSRKLFELPGLAIYSLVARSYRVIQTSESRDRRDRRTDMLSHFFFWKDLGEV